MSIVLYVSNIVDIKFWDGINEKFIISNLLFPLSFLSSLNSKLVNPDPVPLFELYRLYINIPSYVIYNTNWA